jgi:uncharacterized protein YciW
MNKRRAIPHLASVGLRATRLVVLSVLIACLSFYLLFLAVAIIGDATGLYRVEDDMTMGPAAEPAR